MGMWKIKNPKKILVIKPSSLGDIVHSLPFLNALRERFPRTEIHWVIACGLEGLLEGHPMINRLWIINKDEWKNIRNVKATIGELKVLFKSLKKEKFDIVIDLQGLLRSKVLTAMTSAPVKMGFSDAKEGSRFFYNYRVKGGKDIHAVDRYLKIAAFLGCNISDVCFPLPLFSHFSLLTSHFSLPGDYAVLVPGARWHTKRWHAERFGVLASRLQMKSLVVGGKSDIDISKRVVDNSKGSAISVAGKTDIKGLIEIMRKARFVVSNDSGPMHIAVATGTPVIAIFGPTSPQRTAPYGNNHIVIESGLKCSPCFKRRCKRLECMDAITVDMVMEKMKKTAGIPCT